MKSLLKLSAVEKLQYKYNEQKFADSFYCLSGWAYTNESGDDTEMFSAVVSLNRKHFYCVLRYYEDEEITYTKKFKKQVLRMINDYRKEKLSELVKTALTQLENKNV